MGDIYISPGKSANNKNPERAFKNTPQETNTYSEKLDEHKGLLNPHIHTLVEKYSQELIQSKKDFTPIHVDEIASRLAKFYEKIRKVIDWKDDNVLRRGAIERILKRILFPRLAGFSISNFDPDSLAEMITMELIRGGHLPNHIVPKERIVTASQALRKYLHFLEYITNEKSFKVKQRSNLTTFILEIAACEIEEILTNPIKEKEITRAMTQILNERISVTPESSLDHKEKLRLIKISTQRVLYDLDDNYIIYQLLKETYTFWQNPNNDQIKDLSRMIPSWWKNGYEKINSPINRKFDVIAEKVDTVFMLLDDVLEKIKDKPKEIPTELENKEELTKLITEAYEARYKTLKKRLAHLAVFSTLSVFLSNWVTFYIIEVPLAKVFYEGFNLFAAVSDFLIPTFVMFFLIIIIRPPRKENLQKVINTSLGFIYKDEGQEHYQVRINEKKHKLFNVFMAIIYIITTWIVFSGIAYIFYIAQLPITSVVFDTFTIALTVFAAVVVRNQSKELNVDEDRNLQDFFLDIITLPLAKVGSVLAKKWKEYNVVAIFFNFIIETPLAAVLDFIQGWSEYLKERKSELH
jgi:hypothetical protein